MSLVTAVFVVLILSAIAGLVALSAWVVFVPEIARVLGQPPLLFADPPLARRDGDEVEFASARGVTLRGAYLATTAPVRRGVIAFCHELTGNGWCGLPYVERLRRDGFDALVFDFRNHGRSGHTPGYRAQPWLTTLDVSDVQAAVDYLCNRPDADPRGVGLIGVSKGGAAALAVAARDARVRAVATDGAFTTEAMQRHYIARYMAAYEESFRAWVYARAPRWAIDWMMMWARMSVGLRTGARLLAVEPLARRVRQPVFMVHGERDSMIPLEIGRQLRDRLAGRSRLWIVPGARHNGAILVAPFEYERRLSTFFTRRLGREPRRRVRRRRLPLARI